MIFSSCGTQRGPVHRRMPQLVPWRVGPPTSSHFGSPPAPSSARARPGAPLGELLAHRRRTAMPGRAARPEGSYTDPLEPRRVDGDAAVSAGAPEGTPSPRPQLSAWGWGRALAESMLESSGGSDGRGVYKIVEVVGVSQSLGGRRSERVRRGRIAARPSGGRGTKLDMKVEDGKVAPFRTRVRSPSNTKPDRGLHAAVSRTRAVEQLHHVETCQEIDQA